jgi:hypothetical protein
MDATFAGIIVGQTVVLLGAAWAYTLRLEQRLTRLETLISNGGQLRKPLGHVRRSDCTSENDA